MDLCLSVTSRCSIKTAERRITQTTPRDSLGTLVFVAKDLRKILLKIDIDTVTHVDQM